jgi:hypothetical protein
LSQKPVLLLIEKLSDVLSPRLLLMIKRSKIMKHAKTLLGSLTLLLSIVFLSACSSTPQTPTVDSNTILTQAAVTVAANLTQSALLTPSATATFTPAPTNTPEPPTPTVQPATATPAVTGTTTPANSGSGTGTTNTQDAASFVADVSIPDGANITPGANFEKTWRIKNSGVTTWSTAYSIVFIEGEKMGAPDNVAMPREVKPGETVDITVKMTAPTTGGTYSAYFRLRSAAGQFFHLDQSGDLWLKISVGSASASTPDATMTPMNGGATATPTATTAAQ